MTCNNAQSGELCGLRVRTIGVRGTGPGSGKDTAALLIRDLLQERGIQSSIQKFATALRRHAEDLTGIPVSVSETTEGKNIEITLDGEKMTVGRSLQILGSKVKMESGNPDYWVEKLFASFTSDEVVIISDVRFPNEQRAITKRGGVTVMINSTREIDPSAMACRDPGHESETALCSVPPDFMIENSSSVDVLREKLSELFNQLLD